MTLDELIRQGAIERVQPDPEAANAARVEAGNHLESAKRIMESDPQGAFQLAYDGARKAVASMRARGLRVRRGEGAHVVTGQYARTAIDDGLGMRFDRMRRSRNVSEYRVGHFEAAEVEAAIDTAAAILVAVERDLS